MSTRLGPLLLLTLAASGLSAAVPDAIISTSGLAFSPPSVTITAGQMVEWQNLSPGHNAAQSDAPADNVYNGTGFRSGAVGAVMSFQQAFPSAGTYYFVCEAHAGFAGMKGAVYVLAAPTETPTPAPTLTPTPTRSSTATRTPSPTITLTLTPTPTVCPRNVLEFYAYWTRSSVPSASLPYNRLTHLAHAFIRPLANGSLSVPGTYLDPALISNANANNVKVLVSIGGAGEGPGDGSQYFAAMALSPPARTAFVDNLYNFILANGYHGADIDWEFPDTAAERTALNALVTELRAKFNSSPMPAPTWLITGDLSWGSFYGQWWDVAYLKDYMDYFNIMGYDMFGCWETRSGHCAGLGPSTLPGSAPYAAYNSIAALNYYIGTRGVPPSKLQLGLPAYGRQFNTEDLYQATGCDCSLASCTQDLAYNDILPLIGSGWTRSWDNNATSPYLRNDAGPGVISYEDPASIAAKAGYALWARGLAGVFFWELSHDFVLGGPDPLLEAAWGVAQCGWLSPTLTPTGTMTPTRTPTATLSATPSASATPTASSSPTESPCPTLSPTGTMTPTPSASSTESPVLSATPSDSATPSPTLSQTPLAPDTATPTASSSPTPSESPSLSPTPSATPAGAAAPSPTPAPGGIQAVAPVPNPGARALAVKLEGSCDKLVLKLYSPGFSAVHRQESGPYGPGWQLLPLQAAWLSRAPRGVYHAVVEAWNNGTKVNRTGRATLYLLD